MDSKFAHRRRFLGAVTVTIVGVAGCGGKSRETPSCGRRGETTGSTGDSAAQNWEFEAVAGPYRFTEGPVWDGSGVLFSDIPTSRIMRYDTELGECTVYRENTNRANGLKLNADGELFACEMGGRRVARYDPDGGDVTVAAEYDGNRLNSPNDLAFDSHGRLWFTDPFYGDDDHELELSHRSVYRADPVGDDEWALTRMTYNTTNPNGILVSPDDEWLYVAQYDNRTSFVVVLFDNYSRLPTKALQFGKWIPRERLSIDTEKNLELRKYPIEGDELAAYDILHDFAPHRPVDGMCLDAEGNIVAPAGSEEGGPGPKIYVFSPEGDVLETHPAPPGPTNSAFGGSDLRMLYLTGSEGYLYRARTDRKGLLGAPGTR